MAQLDVGKTTTSNLTGTITDISVSSQNLDAQGNQNEIHWDFPDAAKHLGYYQERPEIKSALRVFAQRVCGMGYIVDPLTQVILEHIQGQYNETFTQIIMQMVIEMKVFGDSFAEIIRDDNGTIINLKRLYTGDMRVVYNRQGLIDRYEQRSNVPGGKNKKFQPEDILCLTNDRVGNEIHGTSIVESLKEILDAKKEALSDERKIRSPFLYSYIVKTVSSPPILPTSTPIQKSLCSKLSKCILS